MGCSALDLFPPSLSTHYNSLVILQLGKVKLQFEKMFYFLLKKVLIHYLLLCLTFIFDWFDYALQVAYLN